MRRSNFARKPNGDVKTKYFKLRGGLNLVDSPIDIPPGQVLAAVNYELLSRDGYRRIDGIERSDGQLSPTAASYWILKYDFGDFAISEGDLITGLSSGATGLCLTDKVKTRENICLFAEQFDNGVWDTTAGVQVTADATLAPDGLSTADKVYVDFTSGAHQIKQVVSGITPGTNVFSVYLKPAEISLASVNVVSDADGLLGALSLDLSIPRVNFTISTRSGIEILANGWARYRMDMVCTDTVATITIVVGSGSFTGNNIDGIYAWGAQSELIPDADV